MNLPQIADSGVERPGRPDLLCHDVGNQILGRHPQMEFVQEDKNLKSWACRYTTVADELKQVAQLAGADVWIIGGNQPYFNGVYTAMQQNPATRGIPVIVSYVNVAPVCA